MMSWYVQGKSRLSKAACPVHPYMSAVCVVHT